MVALILILAVVVLQFVVNWFLYKARKKAQSSNVIETQTIDQVSQKNKKTLSK